MALPYLNLVPAADQAAFERGLRAIASRLGGKAEWYAVTMYRESQMNPRARNPISGATGLIQFMPNTARSLGTTTDQLQQTSALGQLPLVENYYKNQLASIRIRPASLVDVYLITLYPKAVGKPSGFVLFREGTTAYRQNKAIKPTGGDITVADVAHWVQQAVPAGWDAADSGLLLTGLSIAGFLMYLTAKFLK